MIHKSVLIPPAAVAVIIGMAVVTSLPTKVAKAETTVALEDKSVPQMTEPQVIPESEVTSVNVGVAQYRMLESIRFNQITALQTLATANALQAEILAELRKQNHQEK